MKNLIGFLFSLIITNLQGQTAILGESINSVGVRGTSSSSSGVFGFSLNSNGVRGESSTHYGFWGYSDFGTGARFTGRGGVAIELGGAYSQWGDGLDDCVIKTAGGIGGDMILVAEDNYHIHLDDDANSTSEFAIYNGTNGKILTITEAGNLSTLGTINGSSDINRKEKITQVDNRSILDKVATLSISEWQFIGEEGRHIGPMVQDFYAAFGLGQGETTIATVDADGIAFAAIQELKKENDLLKLENEIVKKHILEIQNQMLQIQKIKRKSSKSESSKKLRVW